MALDKYQTLLSVVEAGSLTRRDEGPEWADYV